MRWHQPLVTILGVLLLPTSLLLATAARPPLSGAVIDVPRGPSVVIDGRIDDAEWRGSAANRLFDGSTLRMLHDGAHLFLGITAARQGFPSVCVAAGDTIRVFHASAALGSVRYTRSAGVWKTSDSEFDYGMRTPDLSEPAVEERRAYLARNGWLASTFRMGNGRTQELQISIDLVSRTPAIALGYFATAANGGSVMSWPESLLPRDGCADEKLVTGHVPPSLRFDPAAWVTLKLAP